MLGTYSGLISDGECNDRPVHATPLVDVTDGAREGSATASSSDAERDYAPVSPPRLQLPSR